MTTSKNRLTLDYADFPDLKAALAGLAAGDRCKVEFELMVVSNDDGSLEGDIEGVTYDTEDAGSDGKDSKGSAEPTTEEPVMAVIAARADSGKKKADSDAADESDAEDAGDTSEK